MGMDIHVYTENYLGNEDRRWLGVRDGTDTMRSITLDPSTFSRAHIMAGGGQIPSGTVLGKITASGKYGPYNPAATDGRQTPAGFLFSSTPVGNYRDREGTDLASAPPVSAALLWEGIVKTAHLPTFPAGTDSNGVAYTATTDGTLDANAQLDTELGNFIRFE